MALPTQRIKISRNRSRLDPTPKGWYLIAGIALSATGVAMEAYDLSRFGGLVCGLTLTSLLIFLLLEQFREHAPRWIYRIVGWLSGCLSVCLALLVPMTTWHVLASEAKEYCFGDKGRCYESDPLGYLRGDWVLLTIDLIPLALFAAFFGYVFHCNRFYADLGKPTSSVASNS